MTGVVQVGLIWLVVSLVAMAALSAFVYVSGGRRRDPGRPRQLVFDEGEVVHLGAERNGARSEAAGSTEVEAPFLAPLEHPEPAITHPVSPESGALDRLLAGVQMPCGLERLHPDGEDETLRMAFVTVDHEPRIVAVSVVDELERLGMDVEPLSYTEARAWRDGFELAVSIYLEPRRVIRGRRPAFASAPPDSVVIEFSVV